MHPARGRSPRAPRLSSGPSLRSCCTPLRPVVATVHRSNQCAYRSQPVVKSSLPTYRLTNFHRVIAREWQACKANELCRDRRDDDLEPALTLLCARLVRSVGEPTDTLPEAMTLGAEWSGWD